MSAKAGLRMLLANPDDSISLKAHLWSLSLFILHEVQ